MGILGPGSSSYRTGLLVSEARYRRDESVDGDVTKIRLVYLQTFSTQSSTVRSRVGRRHQKVKCVIL